VKKRLDLRILVLFSLIPLSCNTITLLVHSLPTETPTLPIPSPTLEPIQISPSLTPVIELACPIPPGPMETPSLDNLANIPLQILDYINGGGSGSDLSFILHEQGWLPDIESGFIEKDLTGDGWMDLAITLLDPTSTQIIPAGSLFVYVCNQNEVQLSFSQPSSEEYGAPSIYASEDLNQDGIPDLLVEWHSCGAHTCFSDLEIYVWVGDAFLNLLQGSSEDMPNPTIELHLQPTDIVVTAEGIGSIGAGPFRRFARHWTWSLDQNAFLPSIDIPQPSQFRIHYLYDAERAEQEGEYPEALQLYQKVIEDDQLMDWVDPSVERERLSAYATFRIILTHLLSADPSQAEMVYRTISSNYPTGSEGAPFAAMADAFWAEYEDTNNISVACSAAQAYATSHSESLLEVLYFGYANPTYEAEDICPYPPY